MLESPVLQVEVNVQDYFFADESGVEGDRAPITAPITVDDWQHWFERWLEALQPDLAPAYELSLRLTDDAEIQTLNAQYRHKDQPTDVLAFAALEVEAPQLPAESDSMAEPIYLGDIVISVETAQRQAQQQGHSLQDELSWLAAHALLHLLGWDHPDQISLDSMLCQQRLLLQTIGITISYHPDEKTS